MTQIIRNTQVVSVSLSSRVANKLEKTRKSMGQSRSAFISFLIEKASEDKKWKEIYDEGQKIGKKFNITSEDDIDRILHDAS